VTVATRCSEANDDDDHLALDGRRDRLVCGTGQDTREADAVDVTDTSCENV
jgi:hypothetical protein